MKTRDENGHLIIGGWVLLSLALFTFMLFAVGVGNLLERAVDPLFGRTYHFRSIGDALHVHDSRYKILSWDHSVLLLVGAFVCGWTVNRAHEFLEWLERSPDERLKAKQARKQQQEQIRIAVAKQQQEDLERKAARNAARKPMSGWRRLWIVLSVVFGVFAAIIAWQPTRHDYVQVSNTVKTNIDLWATPEMRNEVMRCAGGMKATYAWGDSSAYTYAVDCDNADPFTPSLLWALFPAIFMAFVGLTVRWIYRGFKPSRSKFAETSE